MFRLPQAFVGALALALLAGLTIPASADEARGTVQSVNVDQSTVVLKGFLKDTTYELNIDAKVIVDGRPVDMAQLRPGDHAQVTYFKQGDDLWTSEVRVLRNDQEAKGAIRNIATDGSEITLRGFLRDATYQIDRNATVCVNGNPATFSDLRAGDEVTLTYQHRGDQNMADEIRCTRK